MITVANRIYVHPDHAEAFEERFRNRAHLVDGMPGFISNQVLRPTTEGDPYVVFTLWESKEDFEGWVSSDAFRKGLAKSGSSHPIIVARMTSWRPKACWLREGSR